MIIATSGVDSAMLQFGRPSLCRNFFSSPFSLRPQFGALKMLF